MGSIYEEEGGRGRGEELLVKYWRGTGDYYSPPPIPEIAPAHFGAAIFFTLHRFIIIVLPLSH